MPASLALPVCWLCLKPVALGKMHQIINDNILNIWEIMEDFIYILDAKLELEGKAVNSESFVKLRTQNARF